VKGGGKTAASHLLYRMSARVAIYTLGCKVNAADSDVLAAAFQQKGYTIAQFNEPSDIYIINTCTVTHEADAQCRQVIRQVRSRNPDAFVAVVGCYAQANPDVIKSIPGIDLILGNSEKFSIFKYLDSCRKNAEPIVKIDSFRDVFSVEQGLPSSTYRTRAFLKVQDGCTYKCSYCIVPMVRGPSSSRSKDDILDKIIFLRDEGYKEIVLTAVNLGEYRFTDDYRLFDLLKNISKIHGVPRIRLTSIEPNCVTEELVRYISESVIICHHFHIPLQSGSDDVLKRMRRRYLTKRYTQVMEWITKYIPNAGIGADVMVGFPGETEEHFLQTETFIKEMPLTYLHVFRYSPRAGTDASTLGENVPPHIMHERSKRLIELGKLKKETFLYRQIGLTHEVLFETKRKDSAFGGWTRNYARVNCTGDGLHNSFKMIKITDVKENYLIGEMIGKNSFDR